MPLTKPIMAPLTKILTKKLTKPFRIAIFAVFSLLLVLAPIRTARAWYVGFDGYYGVVGIDSVIDELVIVVDSGDRLQHGGGAKFNFGLGRKWVTEFSVGIFQGYRYSIDLRAGTQAILQELVNDAVHNRAFDVPISTLVGSRYQTPQLYATIGLEGRYYILGDFAYDPDVPNDIFFGFGGDWSVPSFWQGSDFLSIMPSMKLVGGYTRRLTRSLFMEIGTEVNIVPTPPANIFNLRLGLKYAF